MARSTLKEKDRCPWCGSILSDKQEKIIALRAARTERMRMKEHVRCSYCDEVYLTQRLPKTGQRNFCPACRKSRIPARLAKRDQRKRAAGAS